MPPGPTLARAALLVEEAVDRFKYALTARLGRPRRPVVVAYRGLGSPERIWLRGRVLRRRTIAPATAADGTWRNLRAMLKRVASDEVPGAVVRGRLAGAEAEALADHEGFFDLELAPAQPLGEGGWHEVTLELVDPPRPPAAFTGEVLLSGHAARFAVVSDIDDTVLRTDVASLLRMARAVLLGNAHTRLPFPGVAAFFRALHEGPEGGAGNPVVFVSRSPWNIYDVLLDFFALRGFPPPVVLLRDWGLDRARLGRPKEQHKLELIDRVLRAWPSLPVILIGDSGQEDPEIYHRVVSEHPGRVLAVYIRNVSRSLKRPEAIRALGARLAEAGCTLILADDTAAMAAHAAEKGWIARAALPGILADKAADEGPPTLRERLGVPPAPAPTVVVGGADPAGAVAAGAIEDALDAAPGREAPTVVVHPDPDRRPDAR